VLPSEEGRLTAIRRPGCGRTARWPCAALVVLLLRAVTASATPVAVRMPEGYAHGFVDFYAGREIIAHGELVQFPRGQQIENRLTVSFDDGSLYDETVVFTQARVFRLRSYHLVQHGPSFPEATDVSFDEGGRYRARTRKSGEGEKAADGHTEVPPDVYNGMASTLMKNLVPGATGEVRQLAFTPKPHLLDVKLVPEAEERFAVGKTERTATRYRMVLHVSGLAGLGAMLIGKDPPDVSYWIVRGTAPTFVRFEGPLSADGPIWRAELGAPHWVR
jgi:hypothetical protein